jgi:hypothetical protein
MKSKIVNYILNTNCIIKCDGVIPNGSFRITSKSYTFVHLSLDNILNRRLYDINDFVDCLFDGYTPIGNIEIYLNEDCITVGNILKFWYLKIYLPKEYIIYLLKKHYMGY